MKIHFSPKIIILCLALLIFSLGLAAWLYFENNLEKNLQALIQASPELNIEYHEMQARPLTRRIVLDRPRISYNNDIEIQARRMVFQDMSIVDKMPVKMTVRVTEMEIIKLFPSLGLITDIEHSGSKLSAINGFLQYEYRPGENQLEISRLILEGPELGLFCAGLFLSNLNVDYIMSLQNPFLLGAALLGIRIDFFQAGYEDYGLVKRVSELKERPDQMDVEKPEDLDSRELEAALDELLGEKGGTPVQNFLRRQKPLTIKLSPSRPVPFSAILTSQDIEAAVDLLNLEILNQKPDFCVTVQGFKD